MHSHLIVLNLNNIKKIGIFRLNLRFKKIKLCIYMFYSHFDDHF